jgi:hypothetical protein
MAAVIVAFGYVGSSIVASGYGTGGALLPTPGHPSTNRCPDTYMISQKWCLKKSSGASSRETSGDFYTSETVTKPSHNIGGKTT